LYSYTVDQSTGNLKTVNDEWKLIFSSQNTTQPINKLVVKAILSKDSLATDNITPKVFDYILKTTF